ncbi:MAG TPA: hypothetical protein VEG32_01730, partial [Clostridia bacterium]|nr:hypothetical protein [Clostridia bacterium]
INWAADVVVEDRVWIAEDVYIYKGVRIGTGSIVGARSTVTKDLPPHALCLGTPAKAVRHNIGWSEKLLPRPPAGPSPGE